MKKTKILLVAILTIASSSLFAQTQVPENSTSPIYFNDDKVGIGVTQLNAQLAVGSTFGALISGSGGGIGVFGSNLAVFKGGDNNNQLYTPYNHSNNYGYSGMVCAWGSIYFHAQSGNTTANQLVSSPRMFIHNSGFVGIGTTSPKSKLDVSAGDFTLREGRSGNAQSLGRINWRNDYATTERDAARIDVLTKSTGSGAWDYTEMTFSTWNGYNSLSEKMRIAANGNVGIGTATPDYKLDVEGTIRARELKVDMQGADFVFEDDYQLRNLEEVQEFITTNKHLPDVAPAKEMQENGVNQSEMNQLLLRKIEELTLYVIDLKKENEKMKSKIKSILESQEQ